MSVRAVVVAHREVMVAEGIASALARFPEIVPIGVATTARDAEATARRADALALDEGLPGAAAVADRLWRTGVRVVFVGESLPQQDEGIRVSTRSSIACLASALVPGAGEGPSSPSVLTHRERQILALVAEGLAGKQVARHLGISPKTVENHKTRIFAKLRVPNQAAAVRLATAGGLGRDGSWSRSNT